MPTLVSNAQTPLALTGRGSLPSRLTTGYKAGLDGSQSLLTELLASRLDGSRARGVRSTVNGVVAVRCA